MKLSYNGLQQIIKREGIILHAYQDTVGVWTIGTGHTSAAGSPEVAPGMVITKQQNDQILLKDLAPIEKQVNDALKVTVTQNQYDAIISIVFNVGPKFLTSTCMQRLNKKDIQGAADAIMMWNKPAEIIGRRATEKKQFLTPDTTPAIKNAAGGAIATGTALGAGALVAGGFKVIAISAAVVGVAWLFYHLYSTGKAIQNAAVVTKQAQ